MNLENLKFSIIIPVFNRAEELKELLESLASQTYKSFEVIVVEDGSEIESEEVVKSFEGKLTHFYFKKPNSGPGLSRNFGVEHSNTDYFIFFDSDCVIPPEYLSNVVDFLKNHPADSFGGPDRFHENFTPVQKAIGYAMSSFLTTGGIRGGNKSMEKFHPRSFNMGFTREVYNKTKGFSSIRFGEDIDLSIRIEQAGFDSSLIPNAYVFHKRRTDFRKFFKQVFNSGIARINLYKRHSHSLKLVHFLPSLFVIYTVLAVLLSLITFNLIPLIPFIVYSILICIAAAFEFKELKLIWLSLLASYVQLFGYGTGFLLGVWNRLILRKGEFEAFKRNFYK
ncbi:MAG TPA: glycosyltransferase [Cytophagales bacterium]|nr:glycosyltransferase [Cytophagales bacterium]